MVIITYILLSITNNLHFKQFFSELSKKFKYFAGIINLILNIVNSEMDFINYEERVLWMLL